MWGCVRRLEGTGFKVLVTTCDGASCNRKFMKLHGDTGELVYKTNNPYSDDESRSVFVLSDAPHLILCRTAEPTLLLTTSHGHYG